MIVIRWQSLRGADRVPAHGFDFDEHTGINTIYDPNSKYPLSDTTKYWINYAVHLADDRCGCLRVWIDNEIVWDYENGWYYDMSDLRARVWKKK